MVNEGESERT